MGCTAQQSRLHWPAASMSICERISPPQLWHNVTWTCICKVAKMPIDTRTAHHIMKACAALLNAPAHYGVTTMTCGEGHALTCNLLA